MPEERHYYFIINPISGGRSKKTAFEYIIQTMNENQLEYGVGWWEKDVAISDLIKDGLAKGFNTFVAVGGDGTINQVAKELVNTDLILGIIPFGSGNGFARHLGIKGHLDEQMQILLKNKIKILLYVGLLTIALSVFTFKYYYSL